MKLAGKYLGVPEEDFSTKDFSTMDLHLVQIIQRTAFELIPYTNKLAGGDPESELIARIPAAVSKINMKGLTPEAATKLVVTYNQKINQGV